MSTSRWGRQQRHGRFCRGVSAPCSYRATAIDAGFYAREIEPLRLNCGQVVTTDDSPRPQTSREGLAQLRPVFRPNGEVTAGNSCPFNDGAAAIVVISDARARDLNIAPLARIVSTSVTALDTEIMGLGPLTAIPKALARPGLTIADLDLIEIDEAFAAPVLPCMLKLNIPHDKLNIHGGSSAGSSVRYARRPNGHHPPQRSRHARRPVGVGVDVCRRRSRDGHGARTAVTTRPAA